MIARKNSNEILKNLEILSDTFQSLIKTEKILSRSYSVFIGSCNVEPNDFEHLTLLTTRVLAAVNSQGPF